MRRFAALTGAALALILLCGCGRSQADPQTVEAAAFTPYLNELRAFDGVTDASLAENSENQRVDLRVEIRPEIDTKELTEIAEHTGEFSTLAPEYDVRPGNAELQLGESTYSYFADLSTEELGAQLGYWHELIGSGADAVRVTSSQRPQTLYGRAAPRANTDQPHRFIQVSLPSSERERDTTISALATASDPGATAGRWDVDGLALNSHGEYARPDFPGERTLRTDAAIGALFEEVPGLASVEINRDPRRASPLRVQVFAFDEAMDQRPYDEFETTFASTAGADAVDELVRLLEQREHRDYRIDYVSSPAVDGGNFQLHLRVDGCEFIGDEQWPELSERYGRTWLQAAAAERFVPGTGECSVNGKPVQRP